MPCWAPLPRIYTPPRTLPDQQGFRRRIQEATTSPRLHGGGGYDGMHVIYEALKKTGGETDGKALVEAMKGRSGKARAARCRSTVQPVKSSRTSTSGKSRRSMANSITLNLQRSRRSRIPARRRSEICSRESGMTV